MTNPVPQNDSGASRPRRRRQLFVIGAAVLVAGGLAIPAAIFGPQLVGLEAPAKEASSDPAPAAAPDPLTEFRNDQIGFTLSYPASWVPRELKDQQEHPTVLLRVSDEAGKKAFVIRALELPQAVGQEELPTAKQEIDQILQRGNSTTKVIFEPQALELGGLPGYWYFYSIKDEATGQQIGHSHYFLFKEKTMLTFVFETVPLEDFKASAPAFDQIIGSFRML